MSGCVHNINHERHERSDTIVVTIADGRIWRAHFVIKEIAVIFKVGILGVGSGCELFVTVKEATGTGAVRHNPKHTHQQITIHIQWNLYINRQVGSGSFVLYMEVALSQRLRINIIVVRAQIVVSNTCSTQVLVVLALSIQSRRLITYALRQSR